jgi:hypothetical protein
MENYEADDLIKLWQFQDTVNDHSKLLLGKGIELGVLALHVEMAKLLLTKFNQPISQNEIDEAAAKAKHFALTELEKGMKNARGS